MTSNNEDKVVALVTGGIGGIGSAICEQLAAQGRTVVAGYYPAEAEQAKQWQASMSEAGLDMGIVPGDVADYDSTTAMISAVREQYGPIQILVNCAGITRDGTLAKMERDNWHAVIDTNLNSVFNVTRQVLVDMTTAGFGRIVNLSSVNGQKGQFGQTNYAAAKAGMHGFTMSLAQEVARKGVTVNTVAPGYIKTLMTDAVPEHIREAIIATIPVGRMGLPKEIADTVAFLCRDESAFITGAQIPVNGGMYTS